MPVELLMPALASSLASQLPLGARVFANAGHYTKHCGSWLASDGGVSVTSRLKGHRYREQAHAYKGWSPCRQKKGSSRNPGKHRNKNADLLDDVRAS
ncbi:hypothetical protein, partial [Pseudomonas baetica]|uniref:hypothetical protein n=1 Tax=Pseudomonas baetica TaxID=674054 RepID=UPI0028725C6F